MAKTFFLATAFLFLCSGAMAAEDGVFRLFGDASGERLAGIKVIDKTKASVFVEDLLKKGNLQTFEFGNDRYGSKLVQLYVGAGKDEIWIQGALLKHGLAHVLPQDESADDLPQMFKIENSARKDKIGIWSQKDFADVPQAEAASRKGSYAFVVGTIQKVSEQKKVTYLNFGTDWRSDFSVMLTEKARSLCKAKGLYPKRWEGRRVRVRGFVDDRNGPMIVIVRPEALEFLD